MRIRYTPNARECLADIHDYITTENPKAAKAVIALIRQQILTLTQYPQVGRSGRINGTRELIIKPYPFIVAYRLEADEVHILAVVHTSRRWPETFEKNSVSND